MSSLVDKEESIQLTMAQYKLVWDLLGFLMSFLRKQRGINIKKKNIWNDLSFFVTACYGFIFQKRVDIDQTDAAWTAQVV